MGRWGNAWGWDGGDGTLLSFFILSGEIGFGRGVSGFGSLNSGQDGGRWYSSETPLGYDPLPLSLLPRFRSKHRPLALRQHAQWQRVEGCGGSVRCFRRRAWPQHCYPLSLRRA